MSAFDEKSLNISYINQTANAKNKSKAIFCTKIKRAQHNHESLRNLLESLREDEIDAAQFVDLIEGEAIGIDGEMHAALLAINTYAETLEDGCKDVLISCPSEIKKLVIRLSETLHKKSRQAQHLISNFLLQLQCIVHDGLNKKLFQRYSITQNIEKTLEEYPFKAQERKMIQFKQGNDFKYLGEVSCTNHLLFSLIKNSLPVMGNKKKGKMIIKLDTDTSYRFNQLIFKSTGYYTAEERLPLLHNYFKFSDKQALANLCLAFATVVMKSYGGFVNYSSTKKMGTEFILNFPKLKA